MSGDDLTREIEGLWTDAVVNVDEMSVISTFELRRRGTGVLDVVNGRSWDADGESRAHFCSTSSRFDTGVNTLTYSWHGYHPREPMASEYFGVGTLEFDPACLNRAAGWFSVSPRAALGKTKLFTRSCQKPTISDARDLLSDDQKMRREAVKRLLQWRENIRR